MVKLEQIKQLVIDSETPWLIDIHGEEDAKPYIDGMMGEISECEDINDIVEFYEMAGYSQVEGYRIIIDIMRRECKIEE
jgi:hypothetical protein